MTYRFAWLYTDAFWALVALIIFIAILFYFKVPCFIIQSLDKRIKRIEEELDEARRLREEAQQLLAEYQKKRVDIEKESQEIIAAAKKDAEHFSKLSYQKAEDFIAHRTKQADEKIAMAEREAMKNARQRVVDLAFNIVQNLVKNGLNEGEKELLIDEAMKKIKASF